MPSSLRQKATTDESTLGTSTVPWEKVFTKDANFSGDVTVEGNLTVTGNATEVTVDKLAVEESMIKVAKVNTGTSADIGVYGVEDTSGTPKYHGLVRDATDSTWKLFEANQEAPNDTTVNFSGFGNVDGTLQAKLNLPAAGDLKIDGTVVGTNATELNYLDGATAGTALGSKALVVDVNGDIGGIATLTAQTLSAGNISINGSAISSSSGAPSFANVAITGGTIDGTAIGANTPSSAKVTTLNATEATTLDGAVTLGNTAADDIVVAGRLDSDIIPKTDSARDLGTSALKMRHVYSDQITATTINAFTAGGAIDFNNESLTNVDIDSGDISGTNITVGVGKTLDVSAGTITFAPDQVLNVDLATINTANKVSLDALDIDGATEMNAPLVDADLLIVDDGGAGTERSMLASRIPTYVISKLGGGTGVTHLNGTFSIGQAVETTDDVTFNTVTATTFSGVVTDISNHTTANLSENINLYFTNERVDDRVGALLSEGQSIGLTYADNDTEGDPAPSLTIAVDTATTADLGVASFATADFSVSSGAVTIKASGISNAQIANPAMSIAGTTVSLGGTLTAASIAAAIDGESMALTTVTDLDGPQSDLTIFDTNNASRTLTVGHNTGTIAIPGDFDLTGDMKDDLNLVATKKYQINSADVLSATTLGSGVVASSLTSVGALAIGSIASGFGAITTASNISTSAVIDLAADADADDYAADSTSGRLTLGTDDDLSLYHGGINSYIVNKIGELRLDAPASSEISLSIAGTEQAHIDADGIDLADGNDYKINNVSVLSATTLGSSVVTSSVTTVGALNSGSITSGFTSIDVGSGAITTIGTLTGGILAVDNVQISGANIGHTNDIDLLTVASGTLTVAGRVDLTTLAIGGTDITADATELNYVDGVTSSIQTQINTKAPIANPTFTGGISIGSVSVDATELAILDGATLDTTELNYVDGVTGSIQTQLDAKQPLDAQLTTLATTASTIAGEIAALIEGEIAVLDGATAGSAAANKAVVVDGSRDIDNLGTVTAGTIIGSVVKADASNKLESTGLTANSLTVDHITIDGNEITSASDQDLILNSGSGVIKLHSNDNLELQGTGGDITVSGDITFARNIFKSIGEIIDDDYSLADGDHILLFNLSANKTLTLPASSTSAVTDRVIIIKNIGSANTLNFTSGSNIDNDTASNTTLTSLQSITLVATGSNGWQSI